MTEVRCELVLVVVPGVNISVFTKCCWHPWRWLSLLCVSTSVREGWEGWRHGFDRCQVVEDLLCHHETHQLCKTSTDLRCELELAAGRGEQRLQFLWLVDVPGLQDSGFAAFSLLDTLQASVTRVGCMRRSLETPCRVVQEAMSL